MKVLEKRKCKYDNISEKYELSDIYIGKPGIRPGLLTCFLLTKASKVTLEAFFADEEGELGASRNIINLEAEAFLSTYHSVNDFMQKMADAEIRSWELSVLIEGWPVTLIGEAWRATVGVIYPSGKPINMLPILSAVETESYQIHAYPRELLDSVKTLFKQGQKAAIRSLEKLKNYPDIFEEFCNGCTVPEFTFPKEGIQVQGYDAKTLNKEYPLSPLGAYNYLIYLRENAKDALMDLEKGLPRK